MLDDRKEIVTIDLREVISSKDLQIVLMEKLEFPDFYGKNWNAFWDSITGLVEMPQKIIFLGWDTFSVKLPKDAEMLMQNTTIFAGSRFKMNIQKQIWKNKQS